MKNMIYKFIVFLLILFIFLLCLIMIDNRIKAYERETAKMGVDWETNTCYLYWE